MPLNQRLGVGICKKFVCGHATALIMSYEPQIGYLFLQDSATQPKASHKLEQACSEPHSPQLQTCGSGSSSATVIFKGSQSPPEALSPWAQPGCSEEFDLYEFGGDPSHKPASVVPHMPEMHQGNDWNDPLPFVLDSWELDGAPEMKLQQAHMSADCPSSLQQPPFHDPADVAGSRAVQLSWDDIPGSFPFPGSNVGDLQRDMPCGYDQSCFMDSWSDLALLQRALKQPDPATCHFPQQPGLQPALQPAPQPAIHTSFPPALWDSHADDLAIAPAHIPATLMPPAYRPPQDVQAAGFAAPYKMDWPLAPTPDNSMDHDALDYSPQQGPAINAGPILRGRVITPDEYRVQAISRRGRF